MSTEAISYHIIILEDGSILRCACGCDEYRKFLQDTATRTIYECCGCGKEIVRYNRNSDEALGKDLSVY